MTAVLHVTTNIHEIHEQRGHSVTDCLVRIAGLGGNDGLDTDNDESPVVNGS